MEFTAIIKKGEKQFVALCPELDVASQGHSIETALSNLKEAVGLYIEEMGMPKTAREKPFITSFSLTISKKPAKSDSNGKATSSLG